MQWRNHGVAPLIRHYRTAPGIVYRSQNQKGSGMEHQELIGKRFSRLVVKSIQVVGVGFSGLFDCDCGKVVREQLSQVVKFKNIRSCGCARRDRSKAISDLVTKDISGQRFGQLVAIDRLPPASKSAVKWRCVCDCGNEAMVRSTSLRSGHTTSCGCAKIGRKIDAPRAVIAPGQIFGRLTTVAKTEKRNNGKIVWQCSCSCGSSVEVRSTQLTHGEAKSCGCLKLENCRANGFSILNGLS